MAEAIINYSDLIYDDGAFLKLEKDLDNLSKNITKKAQELNGALNLVNLTDGAKISELEKEILSLKKSQELLQSQTKQLNIERKNAFELAKLEHQEALKRNKNDIDNIKMNAQKLRAERLYNQEVNKTEKEKAKLDAQNQKELDKTQRLNGLYSIVQNKLNKTALEYRNLAIKKELGNQLTDKEARRYDFLQKRLLKYDQALKMTDATMGKHQRNVGNYASAYNGLGNSVNQLTREMPAFGNSINTGFMAISNNLPIFFDEISRIKTANKELVAQGKPTESLFKQLGSAVFSFGTLLSVGVTLLTLYGGKLVEYFTQETKAEKLLKQREEAQKKANKESEKAQENIFKESAKFEGYILALSKTNARSKERIQMINKINETYGTTLKNLKDESKFQEQLNATVKRYLQYKEAEFKITQFEDLIARNNMKRMKLRNDIEKLHNDILFLKIEVQKTVNSGIKDYNIHAIEEQIGLTKSKDLLKQKEQELEAAEKRYRNYGFSILEANSLMDDSEFNTKKSTKATKENTTELEKNNTELENTIKLLELEAKLRYERFQLINDLQQQNVETNIQKEIELQNKNAKEFGTVDTKNLEDLLNTQSELKKEALKQDYNFRLQELLNNANNEKLIAFKNLEDERNKLLEQENLTQKEIELINISYQQRLSELKENQFEDDKNTLYARENLELEYIQNIEKADKELVANKKETNNQLINSHKEYVKTIQEIEQLNYDEKLEILSDSLEKQRKIISKSDKKNKIEELHRLQLQLNNQYEMKVNATKNEFNDKLIQVEKGSAEEEKIIKEKDIALLKLKREYANEYGQIDDEIRKLQKEKWNDFVNDMKSVLSKILDEIEKNNQKQLQLTEKRLEKQNDAVDEQRRRAELGLTNTLAFEKKEQAKRESEQIKAQKKLERTQKIKSLYAAYSGYASSGDSANAITKTLRDFAILEGIAATFGGGGIVEDELPKNGVFKGASHKSKSGGIPIMVEGEEGIFSKKEMRNLGKDNFYSIKNLAGSGKISDIFAESQKSFVAVVPQKNEDISIIKEEMQMLRKSFDNIEWQKIDAPGFIDGVYKIKEHLKSKGKTTINNYIIEKPKF